MKMKWLVHAWVQGEGMRQRANGKEKEKEKVDETNLVKKEREQFTEM